ncbi:MAG TPA: SurA N-terminal domain-containing protein [Candidatus Sulfotelmatobacter sp.]|nr:SurA N-terminal domain-containing protein [Candidatus Sulfotelmatobacter sp.]
MIGSIRKHAAWLWWLVAGLTIISFVVFMGSGTGRNGNNGGGGGNYGTLYGHELTGEEVTQSEKDFELYFLLNNGEWPIKDKNVSGTTIDQQIYLNLMFEAKAKSLGIAVPDDSVADAASQWLHSPALLEHLHSSSPISASQFVEQILSKYNGYTGADFEHAVRTQLVIEQLRMALGLAGALVTPQEAAALYDRDHMEASTEAVFFSASNYLSQATATPADVGQFFTNNMAYYRVPDRLQVSYVFFNITNYLNPAAAALTNLNDLVEINYKKYAQSEEFKNLTPDQAKAKLHDLIIRQRAMSLAATPAQELRDTVFAAEPVKPENLATIAKQKGLTAQLSGPFAQDDSAPEFANVRNVEKTAFTLTADSPFSDLIIGSDGLYMIGLANQMPSSIPAFADIGARVQNDYRMQKALALAYSAGTNFYITAAIQAATGKSFASAAVAAGQAPVLLSPFSLTTPEVPEAGGHADIRELRNAAFSTPVGGISRFMPTADGGFVMHVRTISPGDAARKATELPQFIQELRRGRENEAFAIWVNNEASREFRNIAAFQKSQSGAAN